MRRHLLDEHRPIISIDPVYVDSPHTLQVTRCVDLDLEDLPGIWERPGHTPVEEQIASFARDLGASVDQIQDVVLVDDVVFTGGVMQTVIEQLGEVGLRVRRVVSGITICLDNHPDPFERCAALGATLETSFPFPENGEPVLDEICERDFCVFAPMTGRTVRGADGNVGAPYVMPFGRPSKWASMGDAAPTVSRRILELNVELLDQVETLAGRHIVLHDLERQPWGIRHESVGGEVVLDHLRAHLRDF